MYVAAASFAMARTLGPLLPARSQTRDQLGDDVGAVLGRAADDPGLPLSQPGPAKEPEAVDRRAPVIVHRRTAVVQAIRQPEPSEIGTESGGEDHRRDAALETVELG